MEWEVLTHKGKVGPQLQAQKVQRSPESQSLPRHVPNTSNPNTRISGFPKEWSELGINTSLD